MGSPFPPEVDKRFDNIENDLEDNADTARKYAKVTYEPAVDGGASASENNMGIQLPAGAVITRAIFYVNTVFAGAGGGIKGGSVAFQCAGTRDLMEYQDIEAFPAASFLHSEVAGATFGANAPIASGAPIRIQGLGQSVASACTIEAVVRGDSGDEALSSGKGTLLIEYFNSL
jgi:hypothetical protein